MESHWLPLDSFGFTQIHLDSLGLNWTHSASLGFTWIHLDSLDSLGFIWIRLESLGLIGFIWIRLDPLLSPLLSFLVQGKREHGLGEKGKGKVTDNAFQPDLTSHRLRARTTRNETISRWGGPSGLTPPTSDPIKAVFFEIRTKRL